MLDGLIQGPGRRNNLYLHGPVGDRPGRAPGVCIGLDFHGMSESHKFTAEKFANKCRWHGAETYLTTLESEVCVAYFNSAMAHLQLL